MCAPAVAEFDENITSQFDAQGSLMYKSKYSTAVGSVDRGDRIRRK
jgi:hypothetical protein